MRGASARERAIVASGLPRTRDLGSFLMALFATVRAQGADALRRALEEARVADRVTVVTVQIDPDAHVGNYDGWWDAPIPEVSSEVSVNEARTENEETLKNQQVVWSQRPAGFFWSQ